MAGRFPFDAPGGRGQHQLNAAQIRAALGLTSAQVDDATANAYLQAHHRQQQQQQQQADLQRDLQIRQLLLQEQLEQQVQEQQLRAIGEQLQEFPDLQQHYQSLLITEQLNRRREQQAQQVVQLQQQEELRRQQLSFLSDESAAQTVLATQAQPTSPPASFQPAPTPPPPMTQLRAQDSQLAALQETIESPRLATAYNRNAILESVLAAAAAQAPVAPPVAAAVPVPPSGSQGVKRTASRDVSDKDQKPKAKRSRKNSKTSRTSTPAGSSSEVASSKSAEKAQDDAQAALQTFVEAAEMATPQIIRKGTIDELLEASQMYDRIDGAADVLRSFCNVAWSDSESEKEDFAEDTNVQIEFSKNPDESFIGPRFQSALPCLPEEALVDIDVDEDDEEGKGNDAKAEETEATDRGSRGDERALGSPVTTPSNGEKAKKKKLSAVLDYPVPIDTWWPSLNGMRRERRNAGETSDEDAFLESVTEPTVYRANDRKIRNRLATCAEPGNLEKLPHCRLHRVRTKRKKNSSAPEFVYCWQVTEIYPNDMMVCCTKCGTWRHAACGGHYEAYSTRANTEKPFLAVCESCHEEEKFLEEFPLGAKRMERQRMEQLRRALATSAVMRQASFSKHGGTYKWPLGSVSATHIAGHTRSVHARHDKAEKQWSDMGLRLSRGFGYRPKERVKSRTKELERLMISVEDAEAYTERHNMLHFLMRDTAKEKPVGYENEIVNIFDSVDKGAAVNTSSKASDESTAEETSASSCCARKGCDRIRRFDSVFCSDACGVSALESDLMQTLFDASEIHPSVLRP